MPQSEPHEDRHNHRLAQLLQSKGLKAMSLHKFGGGKTGDVYVEEDGKRVSLEAKVGSWDTRGDEALADAAGRLADDLADTALAVCYPPGGDPDAQLGEDSKIWISTIGGNWHETDIDGAAGMVRRAASEAGDVDAEAKKLQAVLLEVQSRLSDSELSAMSAAAGMPLPLVPSAKERKHAGMRVLLLVFAAAMFHSKLDPYFAKRNSRPAHDARKKGKVAYTGEWPPPTLQDCLNDDDTPQALVEAWDMILAKDYKPIYETGRAVLLAPPALEHAAASGIKKIVAQAQAVRRSLAGGNHDLLGRIFHWILDTSKNDGSYYTSTAAATLLAGLAIREEDVADLSALKILDPACGTGTLLMAAAERIADIKGSDPHTSQYLVERVLHGWDINISAAHLAATTLGLTAPDVSFDKMNIHMLKLGLDDTGKARAGSLEMMQGTAVQTEMWAPNRKAISAQIDGDSEDTETESLSGTERYGVVIMNPPFTADRKRHDQFSIDVEKKIKKREEELFAGTEAVKTHPGGMFSLLGSKMLGDEGKTMGFVYPLAGADAASMRKVWEALWGNFYLELVVSSQDPDRVAFSENTNISEMLVILRKRDKNLPEPDAKFVRLSINPDKPSSALVVAKSIRENSQAGFSGAITEWPQARVKAGDWSPAKFFSDYLATRCWRWFMEDQSELFVPLHDLAEVGPAGRGIRGGFTRSDTSDAEGMQALWFNDQSDKPNAPATKICMEQTPDSYIHAKPHFAKQRTRKQKGGGTQILPPLADELWSQRGRLMIPDKIRTTSVVTAAVRSSVPVLGSHWIPVRHRTEPVGCDWEKAMCVYLNSTVGILAALSIASPFVLGMPKMSLEGQRRIPVPKLNDTQVAELASVYDAYRHTRLERLRFPDSEPRVAFGRAVSEVLGIGLEEIDTARRELAEEPGVTGRRHKSAS